MPGWVLRSCCLLIKNKRRDKVVDWWQLFRFGHELFQIRRSPSNWHWVCQQRIFTSFWIKSLLIQVGVSHSHSVQQDRGAFHKWIRLHEAIHTSLLRHPKESIGLHNKYPWHPAVKERPFGTVTYPTGGKSLSLSLKSFNGSTYLGFFSNGTMTSLMKTRLRGRE